ncbi:MAG: hypothetical protein EOO16_07900 [Chitinophagaceae bacterium]|nr:MAG: hypothetical protein EOO16_07900 [Chitinophagaceae bacterium]
MGKRNRHGLSRDIPEGVRREIRSRCGFGCVLCGLALYDYEHFDPDFRDAEEHSPKGMTLLCPRCNQKRARGTLSVETVAKANENPKCKQQGFASELFDFGADPILVKFAGVTFFDCRVLMRIKGVDILSIRPPEELGSPVLLSGFFSDVTGAMTLKIKDNVWSAGKDNWDVETKGPRITIRRGLGDIALQIKVMPPRVLIIERIDMKCQGYLLRGDETTLSISPDGRRWSTFKACGAASCLVGMELG